MMASVLRLYLCFTVLSAAAIPTLADFSVRPESSYGILEGESATIICDSDTALFYHWEKDGTEIDEDDGFIRDVTAIDNTLTITNANHSRHRGEYRCIITEAHTNFIEATFTVAVHYIGSEISIWRNHQDCAPDPLTTYNGSKLTLECLPPEGEPPVNVTWYKYENKIRQVENPEFIDFSNRRRKLVIGPLKVADAGRYRCQAANDVNRDNPLVSESLNIRVIYPPEPSENVERTITAVNSSKPLVVGEGLSAEFVCKIDPPIPVDHVVWTHNTNELLHTSSGSTRVVQRSQLELTCYNALHLDNITAEDEGNYECNQRDSIDYHAQRELQLAVLEGPLVVKATPTSLLAEGNKLTLECGLSEEGSLRGNNNLPPEKFRYQWTHNGSALGSHVQMVERGREIVVPSVSLVDSGVYVCVINGTPDVLNLINASISITVEAIPSVSISLLGSVSLIDRVEGSMVYVQLGAQVSLQCTINSPRPSNFTWLQGVTEFQIVPSSFTPSTSTLILHQITPSQLSSYHCRVSNAVHDLVTQGLTLIETERPYVRDAAVERKVVRFQNGTTLEIFCQARGGASGDDIIWVKDEEELTNHITATGSSVAIVTNGNNSTLTITRVTTGEAGQYECLMDVGGMESRRTYDVIIMVPAKIEYTSIPDVTATTGEKVQFDCVASGIPPPTIKWLFNTRPVEEVEVELEDLGNGSLRISSVTEEHGGSYHCFLANGQISQDFTLTVERGEDDSPPCGGGFSQSDCVTLLSGGSVAVFFLLLALLVLLLCLCILCCRWTRATYDIPRDLEMKRALSSRASSHKDTGAAPGAGDINGYAESHGFRNGLYPVNPLLTTFDRGAMSEMQRSVTPPAPSPVLQTPGTGGTDSMFSSDDQSSLTASLPNFPRSQLTLGEELGEGEFGPVLLGVARNIVSHEPATQVVVKVLVRSGDGEDQFQPDLALVDFANQMKIDYEHIACILGLCTDTEPYYVIYEYLDQGDLKKYLQTHRPVVGQQSSAFSPHTLSRLVLQVADGMAFLFSQRIIHGDLATRNCLVSSDNHIKIADLGIGHDLYQTDYYDNGSQLLPIRWMPPELLVATDDGPAFALHSDIWSFGVLCWEVFTFGDLPFDGLADEEVLEQVPQGLLLPLPPSEGCPDHMTRVMSQCWQLDPDARPRFSALCMDMNIIPGE